MPDEEATDTPKAATQQWQTWVPMDTELYNFLQAAQVCMLQKIHELFSYHKIPYWICGGTLLGAIRHDGGLIPHDDDIDLECFEQDLDKIAAIPLEEPFYTGFVPLSGYWEGNPVAKLKFFHGMLEVDVFPRPSKLPDGKKHFPSQEEVFPLTQYMFHNIPVWGPCNADAYLNRCYGDDWRDAVCVYNHDYNWYHCAGFNARKQVLSLKEYKQIVEAAGVERPVARSTARETYDRLMSCDASEEGSLFERMQEKYKQYKHRRVFRWNRANAEYREMLRDQQEEANR